MVRSVFDAREVTCLGTGTLEVAFAIVEGALPSCDLGSASAALASSGGRDEVAFESAIVKQLVNWSDQLSNACYCWSVDAMSLKHHVSQPTCH